MICFGWQNNNKTAAEDRVQAQWDPGCQYRVSNQERACREGVTEWYVGKGQKVFP